MEGNGDLDVKEEKDCLKEALMIYTNPEATQPIHATISALFKEKWDTSLEGAALWGVNKASFMLALIHSGWQTELWMRHWLYQRGRTKLYCAELPYPGVCMSDAIFLAGKEGMWEETGFRLYDGGPVERRSLNIGHRLLGLGVVRSHDGIGRVYDAYATSVDKRQPSWIEFYKRHLKSRLHFEYNLRVFSDSEWLYRQCLHTGHSLCDCHDCYMKRPESQEEAFREFHTLRLARLNSTNLTCAIVKLPTEEECGNPAVEGAHIYLCDEYYPERNWTWQYIVPTCSGCNPRSPAVDSKTRLKGPGLPEHTLFKKLKPETLMVRIAPPLDKATGKPMTEESMFHHMQFFTEKPATRDEVASQKGELKRQTDEIRTTGMNRDNYLLQKLEALERCQTVPLSEFNQVQERLKVAEHHLERLGPRLQRLELLEARLLRLEKERDATPGPQPVDNNQKKGLKKNKNKKKKEKEKEKEKEKGKSKLCRFLKTGCKYGSDCKFLHEAKDDPHSI